MCQPVFAAGLLSTHNSFRLAFSEATLKAAEPSVYEKHWPNSPPHGYEWWHCTHHQELMKPASRTSAEYDPSHWRDAEPTRPRTVRGETVINPHTRPLRQKTSAHFHFAGAHGIYWWESQTQFATQSETIDLPPCEVNGCTWRWLLRLTVGWPSTACLKCWARRRGFLDLYENYVSLTCLCWLGKQYFLLLNLACFWSRCGVTCNEIVVETATANFAPNASEKQPSCSSGTSEGKFLTSQWRETKTYS